MKGGSARNDGEPKSKGNRDGSPEERPPSGRMNRSSRGTLWRGSTASGKGYSLSKAQMKV